MYNKQRGIYSKYSILNREDEYPNGFGYEKSGRKEG